MTYGESPITVCHQEHVETSRCDNATLARCKNATVQYSVVMHRLHMIYYSVIVLLQGIHLRKLIGHNQIPQQAYFYGVAFSQH